MKAFAYLLVIGIGVLAAWRFVKKRSYTLTVPLDELKVSRTPTPVIK